MANDKGNGRVSRAKCKYLREMMKPRWLPKAEWEEMLMAFPHLTPQDFLAAEQLVEVMARRRKLKALVRKSGETEVVRGKEQMTPAARQLSEVDKLYFRLIEAFGGTPKARGERVTKPSGDMVGAEFFT